MPDAQSAPTLRALRMLLRTHVRTHGLTLRSVYVSLTGLLGDYGVQLSSHTFDVSGYPACCCDGLMRALAAQERDSVLLGIPLGDEEDPEAQPSERLFTAVGQWLADSSDEHGLDLGQAVEIVVSLLADVIGALARQLDWDREETEAFVRDAVGPSLETYIARNIPDTLVRK